MFSKHGHLDIIGHTNDDLVDLKMDRKSTLRYLIFVGGNLVTWRTKKQNIVSLKILLSEFVFGIEKSMILFCDNIVVIEIINNPIQHEKN